MQVRPFHHDRLRLPVVFKYCKRGMCPKSRQLARTDIKGKVTGHSWCKEGPCKEINQMRLKLAAISILIAAALLASSPRIFGAPVYTIDQAVALAQDRNPE